MYNRAEHQEILDLLRKMDQKLEAMQMSPEATEQEPKQEPKESQLRKDIKEENVVWNLTQLQYELSNELFNGIKKLKQVIQEGEKQTCRAKGKYQK